MKKLTHIMLVFALAITCFFAFPNKGMAEYDSANEAFNIEVGQTRTFTYKPGEYQKWLKFTAPETKTYEFELPEFWVDEEGEGLTFILVFDDKVDFDILDFADKLSEDLSEEEIAEVLPEELIGYGEVDDDTCIAYVDCEAGKTYYFVVYNVAGLGEEYNIDLDVKVNEHFHRLEADDDEADYECACGKEIITGLSRKSYTYNGKIRKPVVTVTTESGTAIPAENYKVTYSSGRKSVGSYVVKIEFTGEYDELGDITRSFRINPKGTYVRKLTRATRGFTVRWARQSGNMATSKISGYQVRYSRYSSMKNARRVTIKGYRNTSRKITKLYKNRTYYVQVRTYKVVNGSTFYSPWSAKKSVKTR
ncbi:MAG TPA: fibronectin type III domain-containing protein [Mogibacterium sp.]|nr:fibronectin type III domain-containing protein [Mogibacterium sp.]